MSEAAPLRGGRRGAVSGAGSEATAGRLAITRLVPEAQAPTRAYEGDAGYDLRAIESARIVAGERASVRTGIAIALPQGHAGLVLPRSGLAVRHGIALVNAPGLIDTGYRGEIRVLLLNTDRTEPFTIEPGDRIAQLVVIAVATPPVVELQELEATERGGRGFGSSG